MKRKKIEYDGDLFAELVDKYIHYDRDRDLIKDVLLHGCSYSEASVKYSMSIRQVARILQKADKILLMIKLPPWP